MFRLNINDLVKGLSSAVVAAVVISFYGIVNQPGFDLFAVDWQAVLSLALNAGFSALVGYLGKNFLSNEEGRFLGAIG